MNLLRVCTILYLSQSFSCQKNEASHDQVNRTDSRSEHTKYNDTVIASGSTTVPIPTHSKQPNVDPTEDHVSSEESITLNITTVPPLDMKTDGIHKERTTSSPENSSSPSTKLSVANVTENSGTNDIEPDSRAKPDRPKTSANLTTTNKTSGETTESHSQARNPSTGSTILKNNGTTELVDAQNHLENGTDNHTLEDISWGSNSTTTSESTTVPVSSAEVSTPLLNSTDIPMETIADSTNASTGATSRSEHSFPTSTEPQSITRNSSEDPDGNHGSVTQEGGKSDNSEKPGMYSLDYTTIDFIGFQQGALASCRSNEACKTNPEQLNCVGEHCREAFIGYVNCSKSGNMTNHDRPSGQPESNRLMLPYHWKCELITSDPGYDLVEPKVICEGFSRPGDKWIVKNSCTLVYGLSRQESPKTGGSVATGYIIAIVLFVGLAFLGFKLYASKRDTGSYIPMKWKIPLKNHLSFRRRRPLNEDEPVNVHFDMGQEQASFGRRSYGTP